LFDQTGKMLAKVTRLSIHICCETDNLHHGHRQSQFIHRIHKWVHTPTVMHTAKLCRCFPFYAKQLQTMA